MTKKLTSYPLSVLSYNLVARPPPLASNVLPEISNETFIQNSSNVYTVEVGREIQIRCISAGEFEGNVTWYRIIDDRGWFYCLYPV